MRFLKIGAITITTLIMPLAAAQECDRCCPYFMEEAFSGFYAGGHAGVFNLNDQRNDGNGFNGSRAGFSESYTNVTAGGLIGYDWMVCPNTLIGAVADWNWVNIDETFVASPGNFVRVDLDWYTTIRARGGLLVSGTLAYLTLGASCAKINRNWENGPLQLQLHHARWGWVAGAGIEKMLGCRLSLAAEIFFMHFSVDDHTFHIDNATSFRFRLTESAHVGRIVLNYHFSK